MLIIVLRCTAILETLLFEAESFSLTEKDLQPLSARPSSRAFFCPHIHRRDRRVDHPAPDKAARDASNVGATVEVQSSMT